MNGMKSRFRRACAAVSILMAALTVASCGGGAAALLAGGGIGGTGFSTGVIVAFGSVFVNDVEFLTDANTIRKRLDDSPNNVTGLDNEVFKLGMVVRVRHGANDNNATEIEFMDNMEGPISAVNPANGTFTILGQTVLVDGATRFHDAAASPPFASFSDLAAGQVVEVSGLPDGSGVIHATFLQRKQLAPSPGQVFEIKGYIDALDTVAKTFTLGPISNRGTISVDYGTGPAVLENLPAGGLAPGLFVEVRTGSTAGTLVADKVEGKTPSTGDTGGASKASIEGFPANIDAVALTFTLDGVTVNAAGPPPVTYIDKAGLGRTGFADITAATRLQADGTIASGVLQAEKIVFE